MNEYTDYYYSGEFNIVNQVPVITSFSLSNTGTGTGETALNRAWYNIPANGTLGFGWAATDDDLSHASLTNVPGPGTPTNDGPSELSYGWDWNTGNIQEGTYNPRLTIYDNSGLSATKTMFIGIDRTAPTFSSPTIVGNNGWSSTEEVKGLLNLRGAEFMLRPSDIHDLRERTRIGLHWQVSDERAALCREDIPPLALSWVLK